jgi:hypothetical protein
MLANWTHDLETLACSFRDASPYQHVVIDNFLDDDTAQKVSEEFPDPDASWWFYNNPIEVKYTMDRFDAAKTPTICLVFEKLQSGDFVQMIRRITDIPDLENDPHLHGAGLHFHPQGGKLDMHLDYSVHPITGKERRLNIILYLNPAWKEEYGGHIELWDSEFTGPKQRVLPAFNRAILFQTSDISYHGMPHALTCPPIEGRKSLAIYYVSPRRPNATHRLKAEFRPLPSSNVSEGLANLYEIRKHRILNREDVETHCPEFFQK